MGKIYVLTSGVTGMSNHIWIAYRSQEVAESERKRLQVEEDERVESFNVAQRQRDPVYPHLAARTQFYLIEMELVD